MNPSETNQSKELREEIVQWLTELVAEAHGLPMDKMPPGMNIRMPSLDIQRTADKFVNLITTRETEAVTHALKNLKSIEYPPSGKEYHFVGSGFNNSLTGAVSELDSLRKKGA